MFRLQQNVPQSYMRESRDFQLLIRLLECLTSGILYDSSSITNIVSPTKASDKILPLLATRVGMFNEEYIDSNVLKYMVSAFPYIVRNKGTITGIEYAVNAILKSENYAHGCHIDDKEPGIIHIYSEVEIKNKRALEELLKYVIPAGIEYDIGVSLPPTSYTTIVSHTDRVSSFKATEGSYCVVGSGDTVTNNQHMYDTMIVSMSTAQNDSASLISSNDDIEEISSTGIEEI